MSGEGQGSWPVSAEFGSAGGLTNKKALAGAFSLAFISENILKIWYNEGAVIRLVNLSTDRKQGPFV